MKFQSEKSDPSETSISIIEACAAKLLPADKSLYEWHTNYVKNHKRRIAFDLDIVSEQVSEGSSIIEFGAVPLIFTAALSATNYSVTGVDIAPERYRETIDKLGINVAKCNIELEKLPFENNSFDTAIFNEIFEHLRINPIFTLSEVLRVLKPGGVLMLSTPNLRSIAGIINFLRHNRSFSCTGDVYTQYGKLEEVGHMGHVREYTTTEVAEFLEKIGFEITAVVHRGSFASRKKKWIAKLFPSLRPYASYVARKPA